MFDLNKNLFLWQFAGFTFTTLLGTVLHFLFDWPNCLFIAPISAVNESTWEHMKLIFIPSFIFALAQYFVFKGQLTNFWFVKLKGVLIGVLLIPILFYTYKGAIGNPPAIVNIGIFFISAGVEYLYEYKKFQSESEIKKGNFVFFIAILILLALFIIFTFYQPQIPLFIDPIVGKTGIV